MVSHHRFFSVTIVSGDVSDDGTGVVVGVRRLGLARCHHLGLRTGIHMLD